jgi:hypothetical protein
MGLTKAYIETSLVYGTVFSQALLTFSISYLTENSPIPEAAVYTHLFANLILPPQPPNFGGRADSFSGLIPFLSLFNRLWGKQSKVFLKIFRYLF